MKSLFALLCFCLGQTFLTAQRSADCDTIVLKNGKTIAAVIEKTTESEIFYTGCDNKNLAQRAINLAFVQELRTKRGVKTFKDQIETGATPDSSQQWHIKTKDGNDYLGVIVSQDANKVVIRTDLLGEIGVSKSQIIVMEPVKKEQIINGEFWYNSPHNTRYFWAPNGYGLRKGEGYYQNTWILFNQATYGFSDHFSIGVGTIPIFLFGAPAVPFWVTPKVSVPLVKDKLNLGVGVLYANAVGFGLDNEGGAGITYGVLTAGPRDRNMTLGLGYGFGGGRWANYPTVTLSGMYRVTKNFMFLTENYLIPNGDGENLGVLSVGGRFSGKNIAIDYGFFRPITKGLGRGFWALPWLGVNVPFGKAK